jgi:probable F420-dependent oxidoreductase
VEDDMGDRAFRFGVVAGLAQDLEGWTRTAKWVEDAGYDVLLSPDTPNVCGPFVALTAAATVTTRLRVGTFVLAAPLRVTGSIAWDAASLDRVSGGRFELGLGAGRPDAEREAALIGMPWGSARRRVEQVGDAIRGVKSLYADAAESAGPGQFGSAGWLRPEQQPHPPILVAANGPSLLGIAARQADIVAFGVHGAAGEDVLAEKIAIVREQAGDRFDDLELSVNIFAAGDSTVPEWMAGAFGLDMSQATGNRAIAALNGSPDEMADVLLRRRDQFGVSYITVNSLAMEQFAPVVERLAGK